MRTTIVLENEVYEALRARFGKRKLSTAINSVLAHELFKKNAKPAFGIFKNERFSLKDLEISDSEFA